MFLFLFNYCMTSGYTVFLYSNCTIINKNMHTGTYCQKLSNFNFTTTQSNPMTKNTGEHKILVLTVVFFVERFG